MRFSSHGRQYEMDQFGCLVQVDARPFTYDHDYARGYDRLEYVRESEKLQALRLGFVLGAHGSRVVDLLDFGYGNGAFVKFLSQNTSIQLYGYDVTGVQVDGMIKVKSPHIKAFDVVTFWDVLEHIKDLSFLRELKATTIVVSMPYCHFPVGVPDQSWFDHQYVHRKPDEHVRHFSRASLVHTMDDLGWGLVSFSDHEDVVRKSKHGRQNIIAAAFKRIR